MIDSKIPAQAFAAVDLGASSGRVVLGIVGDDAAELREVTRFPNEPLEYRGRTVWNLPHLFTHTLEGLERAVGYCEQTGIELAGIGVDSWGVDWALRHANGHVELPSGHYRSAPEPAAVIARRQHTPQEIYELSGVPDQSINTALRLGALARERDLRDTMPLFIPDLWVYWLTGRIGTDPTIASTSQLLDVRDVAFSDSLLKDAGLENVTMPPIEPPGTVAGATTPEQTRRIGAARPIPVYRVAGHDTASAFAFAEPRQDNSEALISSGTWSLVGAALNQANTTAQAHAAGFTNEHGVHGILFMQNLSGMWLLQECLREWSKTGPAELEELLDRAGELPFDERTFDPGDERLLAVGGMEKRIRSLSAEVSRPLDDTPASVVKAVIDSLAVSYQKAIAQLEELTGQGFSRIRIVGGGSRNEPLCQLTANLTGRTVLSGPVEASSIGNIAVQAHAAGLIQHPRELYERLRDAHASRTYFPRSLKDGNR